jgi:hypothetical protein
MIDINKKYRTRDGRKVRIYATDGGAGSPVMGAVFYTTPNGQFWWESARWTEDGRYDYHGRQTNTDLIEVRPRHKVSVWINTYGATVSGGLYSTRASADEAAVSRRTGCIKVELDFEEGEGL